MNNATIIAERDSLRAAFIRYIALDQFIGCGDVYKRQKDVSGNRACAFLGAKKTTIPKSNNHSKNYATLSKRN